MKTSIRSAIGAALVAVAAVANAAALNPDSLPRQIPTPKVMDKAGNSQPDFGTDFFYTPVDGSQFHPRQDTATFERGIQSGAYYCKTGTPENEAFGQFHLPHGVRMNQLRAWIHDSNATSGVMVELEQLCLPDTAGDFPTVTTLATVQTTAVFNTGDVSSFDMLAGDNLVDNESCTYRARATVGTVDCNGTRTLGVYKARVSWQRFIPVAPAVATFPNDVPTNGQFFREIEALAQTGITLGCAAGSFCPDDPVTRRTMAAFLARALGLPPRTLPDPANP